MAQPYFLKMVGWFLTWGATAYCSSTSAGTRKQGGKWEALVTETRHASRVTQGLPARESTLGAISAVDFLSHRICG